MPQSPDAGAPASPFVLVVGLSRRLICRYCTHSYMHMHSLQQSPMRYISGLCYRQPSCGPLTRLSHARHSVPAHLTAAPAANWCRTCSLITALVVLHHLPALWSSMLRQHKVCVGCGVGRRATGRCKLSSHHPPSNHRRATPEQRRQPRSRTIAQPRGVQPRSAQPTATTQPSVAADNIAADTQSQHSTAHGERGGDGSSRL